MPPKGSKYSCRSKKKRHLGNDSGDPPRGFLPKKLTEWQHPAVLTYFNSRAARSQKFSYSLIFGWSEDEYQDAFRLVQRKLSDWEKSAGPAITRPIPRTDQDGARILDVQIYNENPDMFQPYWEKSNTPRPVWAVHGLLRQDRIADADDTIPYPCNTVTTTFTAYVKTRSGAKTKRTLNPDTAAHPESIVAAAPSVTPSPSPSHTRHTPVQTKKPREHGRRGDGRIALSEPSRTYEKEELMLYFTLVDVQPDTISLTYITRIDYKTACNNGSCIDYKWLASMGVWPRDDSKRPFFFERGTALMAGTGFEMAAAVHLAWLSDKTRFEFDFFIAEDIGQVEQIPEDRR